MPISNATQNAILALTFQAVAWANYADNAASSPQTSTQIGLNTADPTTAGTMSTNEIAYTSYARASVARTTGGWAISGSSPTTINPVSAITFPAGTGGSGTASFFSTGKTGGGAAAILWSGTVTPNIVCGSGVTPQLSTATAITLD
jgi:hypothetical protein